MSCLVLKEGDPVPKDDTRNYSLVNKCTHAYRPSHIHTQTHTKLFVKLGVLKDRNSLTTLLEAEMAGWSNQQVGVRNRLFSASKMVSLAPSQ